MADFGEQLSGRELEVLNELVQGASNKEIAQNLFISPNTVKVHVRNVFTKLGASSRTEAVTTAIQNGLVAGLIAVAPEEQVETVEKPVAIEPEVAEPAIQESVIEPEVAPVPIQPSAQPDAPEVVATPSPATNKSNNRGLLGLGFLGLLAVLGIGLFIYSQRPGPAAEVSTETPTEETSAAEPIASSAPCVAEDAGNAWVKTCALPAPRSHMAVASIGTAIYQIGGETEAGVSDSTTIYDTQLQQWRSLSSKPTAVADVTATVLASQIYVPGGRQANGEPTAVFEVYSPAKDGWQSLTSLPVPLSGAHTVAHAGRLYVFGGWDGSNYSNAAFVYDPSDDSWRPIASMSQGRAFTTGGIVGNNLFVVGGHADGEELAICEQYDPVLEAWSDCPSMLVARGGAASVSVFNRLYVLGGGIDGSVPYGELYDADKDEWQVVNLPLLDGADQSWIHLGASTVETNIYLLGGERSGNRQDDSFIFDTMPFRSYIPAIEKDQ